MPSLAQISPHLLNGWLWMTWAAYWFLAAAFVKKNKVEEEPMQKLMHGLPMYFGFYLIFHDRDYHLIFGRLYDNVIADYVGNQLTVIGLLVSVWARIHLGKYWSGIITLKEGHKLIRTGPYRWVRHPIYTGMIIAAFGSALTASTGDGFAGFAIFVAACVYKSRREEALLTGEFGDEYLQFKREVPAIFPLIY
jgi:protein-S-isoprenylcysteine O-methyltransferase Ste14